MASIDPASPVTASGAALGAGVPGRRQMGTTTATGLPLPVKIFFFLLMVPMTFSVGGVFLTGIRVLLLILVLPLIGRLLSGQYGKLHWADYLFFAHVAWMAVALGVNNPDRMIQNVGSTGVEFIGAYLLGRAYVRTREQFVALCKFLGFLVLCLLPLALYETQTGRPILIEMIRRLPAIGSEGIVTIEPRLGLERVQAVFAHPIHFGLFCSVAFSMTYVGLKDIYSRQKRLALSAVVLLTGFFGLSSGAFLAMVMQIFLISWYVTFRKVEAKWWILLGVTAVAYVVVDLLSDRTPVRVFMSYATFSPHNAYWRGIIFEWGIKNIFGDAAQNIPPAPIFGIGLQDWVRPHFMYSGSMDNFWLLMGVRFGVPGLGFLALGYFATLLAVIFRKFDGDEQLLNLRRAWVFTFVGLTFTLCTVHVWTSIYAFVFFMFGAGTWFLTATPQRAGEEEAAAETAATDAPRRMTHSRFPVKKARTRAPVRPDPPRRF